MQFFEKWNVIIFATVHYFAEMLIMYKILSLLNKTKLMFAWNNLFEILPLKLSKMPDFCSAGVTLKLPWNFWKESQLETVETNE